MQAFGISEDDVENVLRKNIRRIETYGKPLDNMAADIFNDLDHGAIENAALNGGVEMDEQTDAAYAEIQRQLEESGVIAPVPTPVAAKSKRSRP